MRLSITNKLIIGFALALLLIIIIGFTSYKTFSNQAQEEKWIAHTYEVINQIDRIEINVYEMRFAARSFLYTNDSAFFNKYKQEVTTIATQVSQLEKLVDDNTEQLNRVEILNSQLNELS